MNAALVLAWNCPRLLSSFSSFICLRSTGARRGRRGKNNPIAKSSSFPCWSPAREAPSIDSRQWTNKRANKVDALNFISTIINLLYKNTLLFPVSFFLTNVRPISKRKDFHRKSVLVRVTRNNRRDVKPALFLAGSNMKYRMLLMSYFFAEFLKMNILLMATGLFFRIVEISNSHESDKFCWHSF